jgi:hypothetical protein
MKKKQINKNLNKLKEARISGKEKGQKEKREEIRKN